LPTLKRETTVSTTVTIARATRGGWEKNAANPPQPRIASPNWKATVVKVIIAILSVLFTNCFLEDELILSKG
jgi:hypothetical protein